MAEISPEITDVAIQEGGRDIERCYQCGTCTAVCPWNIAGNLGVRGLVHQSQLGLTDFADEALWKCVGCRTCAQACPRGLDIPGMFRSLRRVISEIGTGTIPRSLRTVAANLAGVGNPMGEPREARTALAKEMNIRAFSREIDILAFMCCYQALDSRCKKVARAMMQVLNSAEVDFGVPKEDMRCCGESIRKAGKEALFESLAKHNIRTLKDAGVKRILASSPHCFSTLKDEYPEFGASFEVVHIVQYLDELIKAGKLKIRGNLNKKVTYHDSCFLGRYQGIYDEPRRVLQSIPGLRLVEMADSHANSLCCGGGAGGIWMESKAGERFAEIRIRQAIGSGAQILAVSCPYCLTMFEDTIRSLGKEDLIEVKDVVELVWESIK